MDRIAEPAFVAIVIVLFVCCAYFAIPDVRAALSGVTPFLGQ